MKRRGGDSNKNFQQRFFTESKNCTKPDTEKALKAESNRSDFLGKSLKEDRSTINGTTEMNLVNEMIALNVIAMMTKP